ncbi:hypothetical protein EDC04DRAFT_1974904 [Pisolithus marmoratus]|nr:hypothetical protein EDC04DRAFT_1974904 [Pisolithus marmoratus]
MYLWFYAARALIRPPQTAVTSRCAFACTVSMAENANPAPLVQHQGLHSSIRYLCLTCICPAANNLTVPRCSGVSSLAAPGYTLACFSPPRAVTRTYPFVQIHFYKPPHLHSVTGSRGDNLLKDTFCQRSMNQFLGDMDLRVAGDGNEYERLAAEAFASG